ncbi:MAG TPA: glycosyltransferase [Methanocorpusculum sp.]|nr:glycosyltransferase [Methanocorpusculum sp.]
MISIVIPAFNEGEGIEACLKSVCDQTIARDQYELIIVDGGSKDNTREIAAKYADKVFIQTSKKVGGARNDGVMAAKYDWVVTADADCFFPRNWLEIIVNDFKNHPEASTFYGPIYPLEPGLKHKIEVFLYNRVVWLGGRTGIFYATLGANTAFRKQAFIDAGMYRVCDAGDDWELPKRMKHQGKVHLNMKNKIGFSMRRYIKFGLFRSAFTWFYVVAKGGDNDKYQYMGKDYK